jgi:cytochrome c553
LAVGALVAPVDAFSQGSSVTTPATQDVGAGRAIATQGANGAAACMGCHGANGEGNAQGGFPRLAALGRLYIVHQLNSYADGTRQNQVMTPIAAGLSAEQRAQVAAYYAGLATPGTSKASNANAPVLAVRGDDKRGIQSCANCHGPQGIGDAGANPYLAGQHATYLANALAAWKDGSRHNDPSGQMPAIAKALTDAEAKQLVTYFASMPPPAPRNAQAAVAFNSKRPAVQSGPVSPTAPMQGSGTQQGSALTGGGQGQGAGGTATNPGQQQNK